MATSFIDLTNLSEPLTKLIEVASKGMGTLYAPFGTIRQAKADAKAKILIAEADAEVLSIQQRAQHRLEYIEAKRQENLERIVSQASLALPNIVSTDPVSEDWILTFFECAQDVCDEDMQNIWASILASETSRPDTYSARTLHFLKLMSKDEAMKFVALCRLAFTDTNGWHFLFDQEAVTQRAMQSFFEGFAYLSHFEHIGLVTRGVRNRSAFNDEVVDYFGMRFRISTPPPPSNTPLEHVVGQATFTQTGQELSRVISCNPLVEYPNQLRDELFKEHEVKLQPLDDAS